MAPIYRNILPVEGRSLSYRGSSRAAKLQRYPHLQLQLRPHTILTLQHLTSHHVSISIALSNTSFLLLNTSNAKLSPQLRHPSAATTKTQQPRSEPRRHPPEHILNPTTSATTTRLHFRPSIHRTIKHTSSTPPGTAHTRRRLAPRYRQGQIVSPTPSPTTTPPNTPQNDRPPHNPRRPDPHLRPRKPTPLPQSATITPRIPNPNKQRPRNTPPRAPKPRLRPPLLHGNNAANAPIPRSLLAQETVRDGRRPGAVVAQGAVPTA